MIKSTFIASVAMAAAMLSVSQATILDLGTDGEGFINGAYFSVNSQHPTGTGTYNPFLTVHANGREQGYNSATGNFDTSREPQWNHEIRFSDLEVTTISGIAYFGFSVDVNEPNGAGQSGISLDGLQIFSSSTIQNSTSVDANGIFNGSLGNLHYSLDLGGDSTVLYDDQLSGSGAGDINMFIPVSAFAGVGQNDYIYMYQLWGSADGTAGGFEETSLIHGLTVIPEMSSFFPIIGLAVAVAATRGLRRRRAAQLDA